MTRVGKRRKQRILRIPSGGMPDRRESTRRRTVSLFEFREVIPRRRIAQKRGDHFDGIFSVCKRLLSVHHFPLPEECQRGGQKTPFEFPNQERRTPPRYGAEIPLRHSRSDSTGEKSSPCTSECGIRFRGVRFIWIQREPPSKPAGPGGTSCRIRDRSGGSARWCTCSARGFRTVRDRR